MNDPYSMAYKKISELPPLPSSASGEVGVLSSGYMYRSTYSKFDNIVIVKSADDLLNIDSSKVYIIDGQIDMGTQSIEVPQTGMAIAGINGSRDVSILTSSENDYTMFVVAAGGSYSGRVVMEEMTVTTSGTNSQVFDLDNNGNQNALDIKDVNFLGCTSLGELTAYRQLLLDDIGFINLVDGLTFSGTWSGGLAAVTSIALNFPAATLFKEGTSLVFQGSVRSDMNFIDVHTNAVFMDFDEANILQDSGVILNLFRTTGSNVMPNLPSSSVKVKYGDCVGLRNTYIGGEYTISSASSTSIGSSDTLVKMAGTTTYADLQWFTQSVDNAFIYDSAQEIEITINGTLSFAGGNNDVMGIQVRLWDDSASSYVDVGSRYTATLNGGSGTRVENISFFATAIINENDRIEIWIENQTDQTNITAEVGGSVRIEERPS